MPVQLRERKRPGEESASAPPAAPPAKKRNSAKATEPKKPSAAQSKSKAEHTPEPEASSEEEAPPAVVLENKKKAPQKSSQPQLAVGDSVTLQGFGGEIRTSDGENTTLSSLIDASTSGVVLFTYPKASTPGCTTQACLFRDSYEDLSRTGFAIYGLSTDSPKNNSSFKDKHKLPYPLLCDPEATLIAAIGMKKSPKGTVRGVFVLAKDGKVLAKEASGGPRTVEVVKNLVHGVENG